MSSLQRPPRLPRLRAAGRLAAALVIGAAALLAARLGLSLHARQGRDRSPRRSRRHRCPRCASPASWRVCARAAGPRARPSTASRSSPTTAWPSRAAPTPSPRRTSSPSRWRRPRSRRLPHGLDGAVRPAGSVASPVKLPRAPILITFDDGIKSVWIHADRILAQHHRGHDVRHHRARGNAQALLPQLAGVSSGMNNSGR